MVCEIQNALLYDHKIKLEDAKKNKKKVRVKGYFRIFLEHIDKDSSYPHIFEIHPVTSIWIDDKIDKKLLSIVLHIMIGEIMDQFTK